MVVIGLIINVNTDAELKALTGLFNQDFVYHTALESVFMFRNNVANGDFQADNLEGWFIKDTIKALSLAEYKTFRNNEINERTGELIELGYTYASMQFPLSDNAQKNLLGIYATKELLTYPIEWNNIDDTAIYQITSETDLSNLFLTALGTKKYHLDSGTALKHQVEDAVDDLAVSQIIDNR